MMFRSGILLVAALLCAQCLLGQPDSTKPLFTHEDMWLMKRVGGPVPSPDGKLIIFSVTDPAYDEKDQRSDLWIVPADGSEKPRQITSSLAGEGGVAWSPDGKRIAFSAKREGDEVGQIYIMRMNEPGEPMRFTTLSTGARSPQWSPDGKTILFTSTVYPGAETDSANKKIAAERKARKYKARSYEGFPVRNWDRWLEDTQPHLFVQMVDSSTARDLFAGTKLVAEKGFSGASADDLNAAWTPDGAGVVFSATTKRNTSAFAFVNVNLYHLQRNGGEPTALTPDNGTYTSAMFSPDGKALYCIFSATNEWVYNHNRLMKISWPEKGAPVFLTKDFDRSVGSYGLSPDGKTALFLAEDAGHEHLYSVSTSEGVVQPTIVLKSGVYTSLAIPSKAKSTRVFGKWESASFPAEVIRFELDKKSHTFLSSFNSAKVQSLQLPAMDDFWFTSSKGKQIHNYLVLPPGFNEAKKYPLVTMIHGGPHSMWRDQFFLRWNYHLLATPGYVILLTDYSGSTGYEETFAQSIQGDPFVGTASEIHQAIDEAIKRYAFIDSTRMAAMGASYGGHMVNWLQGTTTRFKCFVSHAGLINMESQWGTSDEMYFREVNNGGPVWEQGEVWRKQNPARLAANFKTPVLVTVGENDFRVPLNQSLEYWSYLQRQQVPSKLLVFPDENHWIMKGENSRFFYREVHAWLKKHLQ